MNSINSSITRAETLQRAQNWVDRAIPYSQSAYATDPDGCATYRQDCSGYVSMIWHLDTSLSTRTLPGRCTEIPLGSVQPGDALWRIGHIALVGSTPVNGSVTIYEEPNKDLVARKVSKPLSSFTNAYRYNRIAEGGITTPTPEGDEIMARIIAHSMSGGHYVTDGITKRYVSSPEVLPGLVALFGAVQWPGDAVVNSIPEWNG